MALRHLAAALALLGVLSCAAGQKVCETTSSSMFGSAWQPSFALYAHESAWRVHGNITKVNLYVNPADKCLLGIKPTYGWEAANAKRIGVEKLGGQDLHQKDLRLAADEFINKVDFKFGRCITYFSLHTNKGQSLTVGSIDAEGPVQTSKPDGPYGYLAFIKGYTDEPNLSASVGKLQQLQLVWASQRCSPPVERAQSPDPADVAAAVGQGQGADGGEAIITEVVEEVQQPEEPMQLAAPAVLGQQQPLPPAPAPPAEQPQQGAALVLQPAAGGVDAAAAAAAGASGAMAPVQPQVPAPMPVPVPMSAPMAEAPITHTMVVTPGQPGVTYGAALPSMTAPAAPVSPPQLEVVPEVPVGEEMTIPEVPPYGSYSTPSPVSAPAPAAPQPPFDLAGAAPTWVMGNPSAPLFAANPSGAPVAAGTDAATTVVTISEPQPVPAAAAAAVAAAAPQPACQAARFCAQGTCPTTSCALNGLGKDVVTMRCFGTNLLPNLLPSPLLAATVGNPCSNLACKLDRPNCTSEVLGFCTGKVVAMGAAARLHPSGKAFVGYPCIEHFSPMSAVPTYSAHGVYAAKAWKVCDCIKGLSVNEESLAIKIPGGSVSFRVNLDTPTLPRFPFVERPLVSMSMPDVLTQWLAANEADAPVPLVYIGRSGTNELKILLPNFTMPSIVIPNISLPLLNLPGDLNLPVFTLPGGEALQRVAKLLPEITSLPTIFSPRWNLTTIRIQLPAMPQVTSGSISDLARAWGVPTLPKLPSLGNVTLEDAVRQVTAAIAARRPLPQVHLSDETVKDIAKLIVGFRVPALLVPNITASLVQVPDIGLPVFQLPPGGEVLKVLAKAAPRLGVLPTFALPSVPLVLSMPQLNVQQIKLPALTMGGIATPDFAQIVDMGAHLLNSPGSAALPRTINITLPAIEFPQAALQLPALPGFGLPEDGDGTWPQLPHLGAFGV